MILNKILQSNFKKKGRLFVPYLAMGYPNYDVSYELIKKFIDLGADSIELGLPFTDPVADGKILQDIFDYIIKNNFCIEDCIYFIKKVHKEFPNFPFLLMGYTNIFLKLKPQFKQLYQNGVRGFIIPDLPFEERYNLFSKKALNGIHLISFLTLNTEKKRIKRILEDSEGFIYFVSIKGVTGNSGIDFKKIKQLLSLCKINIPILIGFGIKSKKNVMNVCKIAHGFILGTLIHQIIQQNLDKQHLIPNAVEKDRKSVV